jgi:hypothetical protein
MSTNDDLLKKLSLKDPDNSIIINPYNHTIPFLFNSSNCQNPKWILLVAASLVECESILNQHREIILSTPLLWMTYPKKSGKIKSDLNRDTGWKLLLNYNFTPNGLISLDETWSALRLKSIQEVPAWVEDYLNSSKSRSEKLSQRPELIIPQELKPLFKQFPEALTFYETLSYTCKKEYVQWVAEAKKEETRLSRAQKAVEALLLKKKTR